MLFEEHKGYGHDSASNGDFKLSCHVDFDFGGLFGSENPEDPVSVKPRTEYLIKFGSVPVLWASKLQTQIFFQLWRQNTLPYLKL